MVDKMSPHLERVWMTTCYCRMCIINVKLVVYITFIITTHKMTNAAQACIMCRIAGSSNISHGARNQIRLMNSALTLTCKIITLKIVILPNIYFFIIYNEFVFRRCSWM